VTSVIGFAEADALGVSSINTFSANLTPDKEAISLKINNTTLSLANGFLTMYTSSIPAGTIAPEAPVSSLGGNHTTAFQLRGYDYQIRTGSHTLSESFVFDNPDTGLQSQAGLNAIVMEAVAGTTIWEASVFNNANVAYTFNKDVGDKNYELSNHLGNVLSVVTDKKLPKLELDNEIKGEGNSYDFGMRMYDPRVSKFLSLDPRMHEFTWLSPYAYAANNPVKLIDIEGEGPDDPCCVNSNFKNFWLGYTVLTTYGNDLTIWSDIEEVTLAYSKLWYFMYNPYSSHENNVTNFDRAWRMYETMAYMHRQNPAETTRRIEEFINMKESPAREQKIIDFFTWAQKRSDHWAGLELGMMGLDMALAAVMIKPHTPRNRNYSFSGITTKPTMKPIGADGTVQKMPSKAYRKGRLNNDKDMTHGMSEDGSLSFRESLTNPIGQKILPGSSSRKVDYIEVDVSKLPEGSVILDGGLPIPGKEGQFFAPGHISIKATLEEIRAASTPMKFPKLKL